MLLMKRQQILDVIGANSVNLGILITDQFDGVAKSAGLRGTAGCTGFRIKIIPSNLSRAERLNLSGRHRALAIEITVPIDRLVKGPCLPSAKTLARRTA